MMIETIAQYTPKYYACKNIYTIIPSPQSHQEMPLSA